MTPNASEIHLEPAALAKDLYGLAAAGHVNQGALTYALRRIGHIPDRTGWRRFLDYLLLVLGALLLVCGIFFFFAYNWEELHRFARFGIIEALIVLAVGMAHLWGLRNLAGRMALFTGALLVGALLAVFGQEYQTGADSYTLFLNWMLLIVLWVAIGRFAPLWLLLLGLANITLILYWEQVWSGNFSLQLESLLLLNGAALTAWEAAYLRGIRWLRERWYARIVATVAYGWATAALLNFIFNWSATPLDNAESSLAAPVLYGLFLAATLFFYQRSIHDLFVLTVAALSLIAGTTAAVAQWLDLSDTLLFLVLGALVIAQAALAVTWLLRVQNRWDTGGRSG